MMKVERAAFDPQPHGRLACQRSAIHASSALRGKYILGISYLGSVAIFEVTAAYPEVVIITKKIRSYGEEMTQSYRPF